MLYFVDTREGHILNLAHVVVVAAVVDETGAITAYRCRGEGGTDLGTLTPAIFNDVLTDLALERAGGSR